jgi:hypothetical protein
MVRFQLIADKRRRTRPNGRKITVESGPRHGVFKYIFKNQTAAACCTI